MVVTMGPELDEVALVRWLEREPSVEAAWLFGSRARGDAHGRSDVDIAILPPRDREVSMRKRLSMAAQIAGVLGMVADQVDLVLMNDASVLLVHRALREGRLLVDRNPARRIRVTEDVLHRFVVAARLRDEAMRERARRLTGRSQ